MELCCGTGIQQTAEKLHPCRDGIAVEYKYVIRGPDGNITWKPGDNYNIPTPDRDPANWLRAAIAIKDAWDESFRCIHVSYISRQAAMKVSCHHIVERHALLRHNATGPQ
jgi:hypothetical protein